jgi:hypothetical protein
MFEGMRKAGCPNNDRRPPPRRAARVIGAARQAGRRAADGGRSLRPEAKPLFHGRKVALVVKQRMTMLDAECANDDIGGRRIVTPKSRNLR